VKNWSVKLPFLTKTRSDDLWPLFEFTRCEKQKYQVSLCNLKKISLLICLLLTHELLQNAKLISFTTSHQYTETTQCILSNCHNPLQTGLKITNRQHTRQSLLFNLWSPCTQYDHRPIELPRLHILHLGPSYMVSGTRDSPSPNATLSSVYMWKRSLCRSSQSSPRIIIHNLY